MEAHVLTGHISDDDLCWMTDWNLTLDFWDTNVISTRSDDVSLDNSVTSV